MKNTGEIALEAGLSGGWTERMVRAQRRRLFEAFLLFRQGGSEDSVLDVRLRSAPPGLQDWTDAPARSLVTACPLDPAATLRLPHPDASFDWVFCPEVIEYLALPDRQQELVAECWRVARKGVFLTTPNRRHPIEFNTGLPCIHWLPPAWRSVLLPSARGRRVPPALVDAPRLYALAAALPGAPAHDVGHKRVFGIKAHFFLMIRKGG